MKSLEDDVYCAFCKIKRKIYRRKHISFFHVISTALLALVFVYGLYGRFDGRVILVWVVGLILAEIFTHLRWRLSLICQACGFDPVLYLKDKEAAAQKVKEILEKKASNPDVYFKKYNPFKHLKPLRKKSKDRLLSPKLPSNKKPSLNTTTSIPQKEKELLP
ncbi:MAG: hypothetical protein D6797_01545 [Bdellovibrio sp.]|nr:MAG: hypothetical protein D6797_01545 [Bdellovibrio sp.]